MAKVNDNNRYRRITVDGKQVYLHRVIWEQAHGPIPKGFHVHHVDGDPLNNALDNLECVTHGEHNRIHHKRTPIACAEPGCEREAHKRGYCDAHYVRYFRRERHNAQSREYQRRKRAARTPEEAAVMRAVAREKERKRKGASPARYRCK